MPPGRRVVFVTRKFPPSVGGMQTLAAQTHAGLRRCSEQVDLLALGTSQVHLAWWLPVTLARLATRLAANRAHPSHLIVGDAATFLALQPVLRATRTPTAVMVHGLDLTFRLPGYRPMVRRALERADRIIANSRSTASIAQDLGLPAQQTVVVNPAVEAPSPDAGDRRVAAVRLRHSHGLDADRRVLLTVGRLVRRKGVAWFVRHVLPLLPDDLCYLVAGRGPAEAEIQEAVTSAGMDRRVRLLGWVSDEERELLLRGADLFVQPNLPVEGDVEGFGMATIEAAMRGTVVVASRLEGIEDAIADGETGWLCDPLDADGFRRRVVWALEDASAQSQGRRFQAEAHRRFSPDAFATSLDAVLEQLDPVSLDR